MPEVRPPIVIYIAEIRSHARERRPMRAIGHASLHADLFESLPANIMEEEIAGGIVGHKNVEEAVAVKVGERDTHSLPHMLGDAGRFRNVGECPVAIIAIEGIVQGRVKLGMAVTAHIAIERAYWVLIYLPLAVVHDKEIEQAVVVVVEPAGADRPHFFTVEECPAQSGFCRDIGESAVPVVMKQLIAGDIGDEQIGPTVIVVVADGHAHAVASPRHASLFGYVGKRAVVIIVK